MPVRQDNLKQAVRALVAAPASEVAYRLTRAGIPVSTDEARRGLDQLVARGDLTFYVRPDGQRVYTLTASGKAAA